jgi:hypothetical protein
MRITTIPPQTGLEMPTDDELGRWLAIVQSAHPWLTGFDLAEFRRAFWAQGKFFRTAALDKSRYFYAWVADANEMLGRSDARGIEGASFLSAILASGDVVWQRADQRVGAQLELGLNQYSGRSCSNAWRSILRGEPLPEPVTPERRRAASEVIPRPTHVREENGNMVAFDPAPLWMR